MKKNISRLKHFVKYHFIDISLFIIILVLTFAFSKVMLWVDLGLLVLFLIFKFYIGYVRRKVGIAFKNNNCHVFGFRRSGKDLATSNSIEWRFGRKYRKVLKKQFKGDKDACDSYFHEHPLYLSLTDYGYGGRVVNINEFALINKNTNDFVTYKEFIDGAPILCDKNDKYEGLDLFLSEAQLSLPNTEHNLLDKKYPWLPVFLALAGHLYNMNIIINSQEFDRPWVKLRNQQDAYIRTISTFPYRKGFIAKVSPYIPILRSYLITRLRIYEVRESAESNKLPFDAKSVTTELGKDLYVTSGQATKEQYDASFGKISEYFLFTKIKDIKYDTREYHKRVFGKKP